jgi:hypothetical protein
MPANHRPRCDDDQSFFPGGPELIGNDPEQSVEQIERWPRLSTFQNSKLLPKPENLRHKLPAVTKKANEDPEPKQKKCTWAGVMAGTPRN